MEHQYQWYPRMLQAQVSEDERGPQAEAVVPWLCSTLPSDQCCCLPSSDSHLHLISAAFLELTLWPDPC